MTEGDLIAEMEAVLVEEKAAIVRLDGVAVEALAARKLALAKALDDAPRLDAKAGSVRLKRLVRSIKTNGVLLAQARGILSDFLLGPRTAGGPTAAAPARHLSIRA